jgi:hypothetical protein
MRQAAGATVSQPPYRTECSLGASGVEGTTGYVIGVVEFDGSEVVLMGIVARCRC